MKMKATEAARAKALKKVRSSHFFSPASILSSYASFDAASAAQIVASPTLGRIVGTLERKPDYCIRLDRAALTDDLDPDFVVLKVMDYLVGVRKIVGVYNLWMPVTDDGNEYYVLAIYVGKGDVSDRARKHIKAHLAHYETIYITCYECENGIAKHLEQLFLDHFGFELNTLENKGDVPLHAVWDGHTGREGANPNLLASLYAEKAEAAGLDATELAQRVPEEDERLY